MTCLSREHTGRENAMKAHDQSFESIFAAYLAHRERFPLGGAEDAVKFVFQGMLGAGHLLGDTELVSGRIEREMAAQTPDPFGRMTEDLGGGFFRLDLRRAFAEGLDAPLIARMMKLSRPASYTRDDVIRACAALAVKIGDPSIALVARRLSDTAFVPSHSDAYREAYRPCYRVLSYDMAPLIEVLAAVKRAMRRSGRVLLTLDGPCASGKTTVAKTLSALTDAYVVHTDDFVVPHAQKTPERLAIPGYNCDFERLVSETLAPWKRGGPAILRRYDFRHDRMLEPVPLGDPPLLLLEGSYSSLPAIRALSDVRAFLKTDEALRMARLRQRETAESFRGFQTRWIPLENAYFTYYNLPDAGMLLIDGGEICK